LHLAIGIHCPQHRARPGVVRLHELLATVVAPHHKRKFVRKIFALLTAIAAVIASHAPATAAGDTAQLLTPTLVLDWAEKAYPTLFPGGGKLSYGFYERAPATTYVDPYVFRHYETTGHYLGMLGEDILLLGPASGGQLMQVGRIEAFACRINRSLCAGAGLDDGPLFISDPVNGEISVLRHRSPRAGTAVPAKSFSPNEALGEKLIYDKAKDRLFAMTVNGVVIVDNASLAVGAVVPTRKIVPTTLYIVSDMHYDEGRDMLFLMGSDHSSGRNIAVFDGASKLNGTIAPNRSVRLRGNWRRLAVDKSRSVAYVKDQHMLGQIPSIYSADGLLEPVRSFAMPGEAVAIDSARDRLYTLITHNGQLIVLNGASGASSFGSAQTAFLEVPGTITMAFDEAADRVYLGARNDVYVLNAASTITSGKSWNSYGVKLLGAPYMWFEGFAFP
jgi:hypothetical protein